jgi:hypothetical protein
MIGGGIALCGPGKRQQRSSPVINSALKQANEAIDRANAAILKAQAALQKILKGVPKP